MSAEHQPPVLRGADLPTRVRLGRQPYTDVPLDDGDDPAVVSLGEGLIALPDTGLTPRRLTVPERDLLVIADGGAGVPRPARPPGGQVLLVGSDGAETVSLIQAVAEGREHRVARVETAAFRSPLQAAQLIVALAGAGVCVLPDRPAAVAELVHPELIAAMAFAVEEVTTDAVRWGAHSAAIRRAAWRHHDRRLRLGDDGWRLEARALPSISVVLASRRPHEVPGALARLAAQDHPSMQVVVALHGAATAAATTRAALARHGLTGHVIDVGAEVPFGEVLNRASATADGDLLSKWDDDDLYGPSHLVDVTLALRHSGADLAGKAAEFVHFRDEDRTVLRDHRNQERFSWKLAGGTLTLPRLTFDDLGGFAPVGRSVDRYLLLRLKEAGGRAYRTHGFGFVLVRHGDGHTWNPPEGQLDTRVERTWPGIPEVAGVTGPTLPAFP